MSQTRDTTTVTSSSLPPVYASPCFAALSEKGLRKTQDVIVLYVESGVCVCVCVCVCLCIHTYITYNIYTYIIIYMHTSTYLSTYTYIL
jgi:hypothetical protein